MKFDIEVIELMLKLAKKAYKKGEIPVSALILDKNGKVVSSAYNTRQGCSNVLGHAEISAILKAERKIKDWRLDDYYMIVSLEPCDMCSMVIKECRLDKVYYFVSKRNTDSSNFVEIDKELIDSYAEYSEKFKDLLTLFFDNKR